MTQNGLERRVEKLENGRLDPTGQPLEKIIIYIPDNGRNPGLTRSNGSDDTVVIYDPAGPEEDEGQ